MYQRILWFISEFLLSLLPWMWWRYTFSKLRVALDRQSKDIRGPLCRQNSITTHPRSYCQLQNHHHTVRIDSARNGRTPWSFLWSGKNYLDNCLLYYFSCSQREWLTDWGWDNDLIEAWLLMVIRIHLRTFKRKRDMMTISYYLRLLDKNCDKMNAYLIY